MRVDVVDVAESVTAALDRRPLDEGYGTWPTEQNTAPMINQLNPPEPEDEDKKFSTRN